MFQVEWLESALNELARLWTQADSQLRKDITQATRQSDVLLQQDPIGNSESRPNGRRILFVSPLGIIFRIEPDGQTVTVLRVWTFPRRKRS